MPISEKEYYDMTDQERDKWVAVTFGLPTEQYWFGAYPQFCEERLPDHHDSNTVMAVISSVINNMAIERDPDGNWGCIVYDNDPEYVLLGGGSGEFCHAVYLAIGRAKGEIE